MMLSSFTNNLDSDLENISDWLTVNKLQSHPSKAKYMVIGPMHNLNTKAGDARDYHNRQ